MTRNRARHAGIQFAPRQRFTKTQGIEFGAGEFGAGVMIAQFAIGGADAAGESFAFRPRKAFGEVFQHAGVGGRGAVAQAHVRLLGLFSIVQIS